MRRTAIETPKEIPITQEALETTPTVAKNKSYILEISKKYDGVPYMAMIRILHHEYWDSCMDWFGLKDSIQNDCARQGTLKYTNQNWLTKSSYIFQLENNLTGANSGTVEAARMVERMTAKKDLEEFWNAFNKDKQAEDLGQKHEVRDARKNWMYSSLGIAQIQIYLALSMAVRGSILNEDLVRRFKEANGEWSLSNVAKVLASEDHDSIELLAAELAEIHETWMDALNIDISKGVPITAFVDSDGLLFLRKILWLLDPQAQKLLLAYASDNEITGYINYAAMNESQRRALKIPDSIPAEDFYLQMHLKGNAKYYALRSSPIFAEKIAQWDSNEKK